MTTITLYRGTDCWLAQWSGEDAAEIKRLFGTDILPTAFTNRAESSEVFAAIQGNNPGRLVCLA